MSDRKFHMSIYSVVPNMGHIIISGNLLKIIDSLFFFIWFTLNFYFELICIMYTLLILINYYNFSTLFARILFLFAIFVSDFKRFLLLNNFRCIHNFIPFIFHRHFFLKVHLHARLICTNSSILLSNLASRVIILGFFVDFPFSFHSWIIQSATHHWRLSFTLYFSSKIARNAYFMKMFWFLNSNVEQFWVD